MLSRRWVDGIVRSTQVLSAVVGVAGVLTLTLIDEGDQAADRIATSAFAVLAMAVFAGFLSLATLPKPVEHDPADAQTRWPAGWYLGAVSIVVIAVLSVQTWFRPGSVIAGGDASSPYPLAWMARMFDPWVWTGSTLGEPSELPLALPWAAVLFPVHSFGGTPELAQRIWFTVLFVGAGLSAFALLFALRTSPAAAVIGTAVYLLNPYVVTWVNTLDVYLCALFLTAALPAVILAVGSRKISMLGGSVLISLLAPLMGYTFFNPPLLGLALGAGIAAIPLAAWLDGIQAGKRSAISLVMSIPLVVGLSSYWIVPVILHLTSTVPDFSGVSGWAWEEGRATIRNAFWLNTHWGWAWPQYFPYSSIFDQLPFSLARFVMPALAFAALIVTNRSSGQSATDRRRARLAVSFAGLALFLILFSTGTNRPGNLIFDPLFSLPYGWLIREPSRFLMLAALAFGVLIATTVDSVMDMRLQKPANAWATRLRSVRFAVGPAAIATMVLLGFPIYTGSLVPDSGPTIAPWAVSSRTAHVVMPEYWQQMARVVDGAPVQGSVLVLPPDDWYEMPYSWYYGNDAFVADLFHRPVLLPNGQGYTPASGELLNAVHLVADGIVQGKWTQTQAVLGVLNAPLILVRRDIVAPFPSHVIVSPNVLNDALLRAPNFNLIAEVGSLDLFELKIKLASVGPATDVVAVNTNTPDLRLLSVLRPGAALVPAGGSFASLRAVQSPPLASWTQEANELVWQPAVSTGSSYQLADLDSGTIMPLPPGKPVEASGSQVRAIVSSQESGRVTVSALGVSALANGDFAMGLWGPVSNCNWSATGDRDPGLEAKIVSNAGPSGGLALRLGASAGTACIHQALKWSKGPVVLNLWARERSGSPPRVCIWEEGPNRCANTGPLPTSNEWTTYRTSVSPDAGTQSLILYLYADAGPAGPTVDEYADIQALTLPVMPSLAVLYAPGSQGQANARLVVLHESFSSAWAGPTGSSHILVDGLLNGWVVPEGHESFTPRYSGDTPFRLGAWVSVTAFVFLLFGAILLLGWRSLSGRCHRLTGSDSCAEIVPRATDDHLRS